MSTTTPQWTARIDRAPDGLVWHRLLGPSDVGEILQQPLPLKSEQGKAIDRGVPPALKAVIVNLVMALVEILAGRRPPHQLHEWASTAVADRVENLCVPHQQRDWRLRSLRAQQPNRLTVEVTVHLAQAGRSRAAALRISSSQQRWMITEFCITPAGEA